MYVIVTVPLALCDPDAGTVRLSGHDYPCSAPIDLWDELDHKYPDDAVSVVVDLAAPEALEDPDVYGCDFGEDAQSFVRALAVTGELFFP